MTFQKTIVGLLLAVGADGQSSSPPAQVGQPPAGLRRQPPDAVPSPDKYPFEQLLGIAREGETSRAAHPRADSLSEGASMPLIDVVPTHATKEIPLPPSTSEALGMAHAWMDEKSIFAAGKDGRVLYTYGSGLATLVCAPLRICILELEPGEKITGEPQIGDSVRWLISPATSGRGPQETPMIVIKPKQAGLDTTLLVTTDRRAYYLRLISRADDFLARVAFSYPEDDSRRWRTHLEEQNQRRKDEADAQRISPIESIESLYFDYRIIGGDENMRPVRVVDDGKKTYIQMTPNAAAREVPVLVVAGSQGAEMVNYRVKGDIYIVDRLFERGALMLGAGKKAKKAEIVRGTYRGKLKGDPLGQAAKSSLKGAGK